MSFWQLIRAEYFAIVSNRAIMIIMVGGIIGYSLFYPLPYLNQIPRDQKVAVVNLDNTALSRKLERMVDATPQVQIVSHSLSVHDAEQALVRGKVAGLLVIPENFARDLRLNRRPSLSYAGDASYFLVYGTLVEGLAKAGGTLAAGVKVVRQEVSGVPNAFAAANYTAIKLKAGPLFNPTMGYVNYVVPAIFVMILHQIMIVVAGLLGGTQNELDAKDASGYWRQVPFITLLVVRVLLLSTLFVPPVMFYFGVSFPMYHINQLADFSQLVLLLVPFLLSAAALGTVVGLLVPRRELASLVVLVSSFPLVFCAGFIWPVEAIPQLLRWIVQWIPCTPAIQAFLRLNQMGAEFTQILPLWWQMVGLAGFYLLLAVLIHQFRQRRYQIRATTA